MSLSGPADLTSSPSRLPYTRSAAFKVGFTCAKTSAGSARFWTLISPTSKTSTACFENEPLQFQGSAAWEAALAAQKLKMPAKNQFRRCICTEASLHVAVRDGLTATNATTCRDSNYASALLYSTVSFAHAFSASGLL